MCRQNPTPRGFRGSHRRGDRQDQGNDRLWCAGPRRPAAQGGRPRRPAGPVPQLAARSRQGPLADPRPGRPPGRRHLRHQPRTAPAAGRDDVRRRLPPRRHRPGVPRGTPDPGTGRDRDGRPGDDRQGDRGTARGARRTPRRAQRRGAGRQRPRIPPADRARLGQHRALLAHRQPVRAHHPRPDLARADRRARSTVPANSTARSATRSPRTSPSWPDPGRPYTSPAWRNGCAGLCRTDRSATGSRPWWPCRRGSRRVRVR